MMVARNGYLAAEDAGSKTESAMLLAEAAEAGGIAAWRWDVESGQLTWSMNLDAVRLEKLEASAAW